MKEKRQVRQVTDPAWVIRWIDPYGLECKSGSYEEAKAYAEKKSKRDRKYISDFLTIKYRSIRSNQMLRYDVSV
mgnify:CR=1 FL=1